MTHHRIASCLGALALLFGAVSFTAAPADARNIPGLGEVSDCVPGSRICNRGTTPPKTSKAKQAQCISTCRKQAAKAGPFDDKGIVYGVCMRRCAR